MYELYSDDLLALVLLTLNIKVFLDYFSTTPLSRRSHPKYEVVEK